MEHLVNQPVANQGFHAEASQADDIVDLVQEIENLNKDDAIKRLLELEEQHEKTFFEIGGVLSAIKKNKWFDEFATLDEWVEKKTALSRSSARALIQIYDAIVKSGVELAKVKHLEWTKLRAIAGVLDGENADHWIEMASSHSRAKIKTLVQEHLAGSAAQKPAGSAAAQFKTFKVRDNHFETVQAAIDKAKALSGVQDDSAALKVICTHYTDSKIAMTPDFLAATVGNFLKKDATGEFREKILASLTPYLESQAD